jgi:GT2 family glycosyltransferase
VGERVSVVATVRDELEAVPDFVAGLRAQRRPADEVVVVDGGSTDGTFELLQREAERWPVLRVLQVRGANISAGRNVAIREAAGPVIAVTDAGTVAEPGWLAALVAPFEEQDGVGVTAGWFRPGGRSWFERSLGAVITPHLREVTGETFLPSSRSVAFTKAWWTQAGGYPEWLPHCEDLVFDLELRRRGARFAFCPDAVVVWRSRPSLRGFFRQYFLYARGDGIAGLFGRRHAVRYSSYGIGVGLLAARRWRASRLALALGGVAYLGKFERRVVRHLGRDRELPVAALLVPVIVATGDVAKMLGYPVGRWRRRAAMAAR